MEQILKIMAGARIPETFEEYLDQYYEPIE